MKCNCRDCPLCKGEHVVCSKCNQCTRCSNHKPKCAGCGVTWLDAKVNNPNLAGRETTYRQLMKQVIFLILVLGQLGDFVTTWAFRNSHILAELNPLLSAGDHPAMLRIALFKLLGLAFIAYKLHKTNKLWIYWILCGLAWFPVINNLYYLLRF